MRLFRPLTAWGRALFHGAAVIVLVSWASAFVGCEGVTGGQPPKPESQQENEKKIQALVKQGKSLPEIRAIMKGEPLTKKGSKKPVRKH